MTCRVRKSVTSIGWWSRAYIPFCHGGLTGSAKLKQWLLGIAPVAGPGKEEEPIMPSKLRGALALALVALAAIAAVDPAGSQDRIV